MSTVLVVGATGHVGRPVAGRLLADGHCVRVLVRDESRAREVLGDGFHYVPGLIQDREAVTRAVEGCQAVHISVAGTSPTDMVAVEAVGTAVVATAAAAAGVSLLTYVSGNLVRQEYGPKLPEHRAKIAAEDALRASGVPYVIFRPTYFMENLPRHVQGRLALTIGRPRPLHMVAAADFAAMVSRAGNVTAIANQEVVVFGPEPLTIQEALRVYRDVVRPELRCVTVPIPVMAAANRLLMGGKLTGPLQLMQLLERVDERGDPTITERWLGAPTTTLQQWCEQRQSARPQRRRGAMT
jgi:uncharacterized protein YbjT (DUF2867 family)